MVSGNNKLNDQGLASLVDPWFGRGCVSRLVSMQKSFLLAASWDIAAVALPQCKNLMRKASQPARMPMLGSGRCGD